MGKIKDFKGGFEVHPEGVFDFTIEDVDVMPPAGEPKKVTVKCTSSVGKKFSNSYNIPQGNGALYVLATKGCGMDPADWADEGFDPEDMIGRAFRAEIKHRTSDRGNTFANLGNIEGPAKPKKPIDDDMLSDLL